MNSVYNHAAVAWAFAYADHSAHRPYSDVVDLFSTLPTVYKWLAGYRGVRHYVVRLLQNSAVFSLLKANLDPSPSKDYVYDVTQPRRDRETPTRPRCPHKSKKRQNTQNSNLIMFYEGCSLCCQSEQVCYCQYRIMAPIYSLKGDI